MAERINTAALIEQRAELVKREDALRGRWSRSREHGHQLVDEMIENAGRLVADHEANLLHAAATSVPLIPAGIADAYLLATSTELQARLHAVIDAAPLGDTWGSFTCQSAGDEHRELREVQAEIDRIDRELAVAAAEDELREAKKRIKELIEVKR